MIGDNNRVLVQGRGYERIEGVTAPFAFWTGTGVDSTENLVRSQGNAVLVRLVNGIELVCSENQGIRTLRSSLGTTRAVELTGKHNVSLSENTFEFDYLDLECYKYLNKLNSEEAGILVGLSYTLGADNSTLDISEAKLDTIKELDRLLPKLGVEYEKETYFKRGYRHKYSIHDWEYLAEIDSFRPKGQFPEIFWKSKVFLKGFLKALFTFGQVGTELFILRSAKGSVFLKDVQQALLLFGVNSSYSNGLKASQLLIFKNSCYRFANNIGIFNAEELFRGVDFERFLDYKDNTKRDMRYSKVLRVEQLGSKDLIQVNVNNISVNGVILENYE